MRILLIFGTRPEAIKMCPLVLELKRRKAFSVSVCVTGQHREILSEVLDTFGIVPQWNLCVMEEGQSTEQITQKLFSALPAVLNDAMPDLVLVHGDTASAFAAALCCFYRGIPIGHIEAGLRTGNMNAPFPEEFHRQAIGLMASTHFAPTECARDALLAEGKSPESVFVTGNTGIDALKTTVREDFSHPLLDGTPFLFLTAHRRENLGAPLVRIFRASRRILDAHPDLRLICPLHPNPAIRKVAKDILASHPRAHLIPPLPFSACHNFLARADLILTDSGGIQEEAVALGRPILVLRDATERFEGVSAGLLKTVGTKETEILASADQLLALPAPPPSISIRNEVFGNGSACKHIADILETM